MTKPLPSRPIATISKEFAFSASHSLDGLPADHPCSRLHGHNYVVRVELTGYVMPVGFVVDYRRLDWFKELLDTRFDHRHLNDTFPGQNPTAENLAAELARLLARWVTDTLAKEQGSTILAVSASVSETPKTWATASIHADDWR